MVITTGMANLTLRAAFSSERASREHLNSEDECELLPRGCTLHF
jgi:hypothetical protein